MAMIDKVNGKIRVNCIILTRGVIPNFAGVMGPILQPRPIDLNDVLILIRKGVDIRGVDRNNRHYKIEDAVVLNEQNVLNMVDEFKNGKKPVNNPKPNKPIQQPKQQAPVQQQPQPVVEEQPKEVVVENKVEEPVVKQQEQQPKVNNNNKNNNKNKNNKNNK